MTPGEALAKIDWQRVTLHIRSSGLAAATIARKVNSDDRHIQRIASGEVREPRIRTAIALLDLHLDRCPDRHSLEAIGR